MQAELTGTPAADETSDAVLLLRTREGDSEAYGSLYLRHVAAARVLARQLARDPSEADELVAESFTRVLSVLQRGAGPEAAFRPYLLSTMRRLHVDRRVAEKKTQPTDDLTPHDPGEAFVDLPADELERSIVSTAFASLPERWRLVLWHTEVEGLQPAQVAPLLGISANATAALAVRARAGLRDAYLSAHVNDASDPKCREVGPSLGGYVRGTLSRRERVAVDSHLDSCARCSAAVLELSDTAATMRGVIGPLILGAAVLGYREGLLALGPHAIPSAALLHSAGVASVHGAAGTAGTAGTAGSSSGAAGSGSGFVAGIAARPTWQLVGAAGVAGLVAVATALAFALSGSPSRQVADNPGSSPTSPRPSATSTTGSTPTPTPSPSTGSTTPSSGSTGVQAQPVGAAPGAPASSTNTTTAPPPQAPLEGPLKSKVSFMAVGDLVAGRDSVLRLTTNNPNSSAVSQTVSVDLPTGVSLSTVTPAVLANATNAAYTTVEAAALSRASLFAPAATFSPAAVPRTAVPSGTCIATTVGATCSFGTVAARATATLEVPVTIDPTAKSGSWSVTITSHSGSRSATVTVSGRFTLATGGVSAVWSGAGRYQVSAGGANLLSCEDGADTDPDCLAAEARDPKVGVDRLDNNAWVMHAVDDAGSGWTTSSSAKVAVPSGSKVVAAFLQWSASGLEDVAGASHAAAIQGPNGGKTSVTASAWQPVALPDVKGYVATANVTKLVAAQGGGSWTVGDIAFADGAQNLYAGWSLTVITTSATAPVRDVTVLQGPWLLKDSGSTWTGTPPGLAGHPADLTLVAWEGDAGLAGDRLVANGSLTPTDGGPPVEGGSPTTYNVAESFADGAKRANTFGVDVRQLHAGAKQGSTLKITTTGDSWILGLMIVSAGDAAAL